MIDRRKIAEPLGQSFALDHRFHLQITTKDTKNTKAAKFCSCRSYLRELRVLRGSSDVREIHIRRHAGAQVVVIVWQPNFHPEHLTDAIFDRLHIARSELRLTIDL